MKDELFEELVASVREGGAMLRGEVAPARKFSVAGPEREAHSCQLQAFAGRVRRIDRD